MRLGSVMRRVERLLEVGVDLEGPRLGERQGLRVDHPGRRVAGDLAHAGLADVGCEGRAAMWRGGEAGGTVWRLTLTQLREAMLATGLVTTADIDAAIALCADARFSFLSQVTMAAWGRRPRAN
jgi:hypothetical protein